jgi:hypothetical protein
MPAPAISDPWLDVGQMKLQSPNISPQTVLIAIYEKENQERNTSMTRYPEMFRQQLVRIVTGCSVQPNGALEEAVTGSSVYS